MLESYIVFFPLINRQLAEAGAHVVMAVRNPKAADELIKKWQDEWSGRGLPLNIEVSVIDTHIILPGSILGTFIPLEGKSLPLCLYTPFFSD